MIPPRTIAHDDVVLRENSMEETQEFVESKAL